MGHEIARRYVPVGRRFVHYRRAGDGSPVVLLHESPMHSGAYVDLIRSLSPRFTVFAFDTPGFGDSDPLSVSRVDARVFADALAETFAVLAMPPCPIYGLDTGAAIALAFGARHPTLTTGLVLNGLPIFSPRDRREFLRYYAPRYRPVWDGGHLAALWTRIRDHRTFFPWYRRDETGRRLRGMPQAEELQDRTMGFLRAGDHYRHGYNSAFGQDAVATIKRVLGPITFLGRRDDTLLSPALKTLKSLRRHQQVVWVPSSRPKDIYAAIARAFAKYARGTPPEDIESLKLAGRPGVTYIDLPSGQVRVRGFFGRAERRPLLLLHDLPGSSAMVTEAVRQLAHDRPVLAFDLPGTGDSDPLPQRLPRVFDFAQAIGRGLGGLGIRRVDIAARGLAVPIAVELAAAFPKVVGRLVLEDVVVLTTRERREFLDRYCPSIKPEWDGAHLYRTWLMVRDHYLFWPWFARTAVTALKRPFDFSPELLHRRALEILKSGATYHLPIDASLRYDSASRFRRVRVPVMLCAEPWHPAHAKMPQVAKLFRAAEIATLDAGYESRRQVLDRFLAER